jgi:hypothetical protein
MKRAIRWTGENLQKLKVFVGPELIETYENYKGGVTLKLKARMIYIPREQWLSEHANGTLVRSVEEPVTADPLGR